jgi:hypothetical protein
MPSKLIIEKYNCLLGYDLLLVWKIGTCFLHLQGTTKTLNVEVACSSITLVPINQTKMDRIPEDSKLHSHLRKQLKSHAVTIMLIMMVMIIVMITMMTVTMICGENVRI